MAQHSVVLIICNFLTVIALVLLVSHWRYGDVEVFYLGHLK